MRFDCVNMFSTNGHVAAAATFVHMFSTNDLAEEITFLISCMVLAQPF